MDVDGAAWTRALAAYRRGPRVGVVAQPLRDLLARPLVVVVEMNDDGADRQALLRARRAAAHFVVQAVEQQIQPLRPDAVGVARNPVDAFVGGAERARALAAAVVLAERLVRPPLDAL